MLVDFSRLNFRKERLGVFMNRLLDLRRNFMGCFVDYIWNRLKFSEQRWIVLRITAFFVEENDVPDFIFVSFELLHVMTSTLDEVSSLDEIRHSFENTIFPKSKEVYLRFFGVWKSFLFIYKNSMYLSCSYWDHRPYFLKFYGPLYFAYPPFSFSPGPYIPSDSFLFPFFSALHIYLFNNYHNKNLQPV